MPSDLVTRTVLADVEPLPFVPCKGALGLWTVPEEVRAAIAVEPTLAEGLGARSIVRPTPCQYRYRDILSLMSARRTRDGG